MTELIPHQRPGCYQPAMTDKEWRMIVEMQCFRCFYCGKGIHSKIAEPDHLWPKSTGGCSCSGNRVAACLDCNSMKTGKSIESFLAQRPQFLRTTGQFSTRIVLLRRTPSLFWNHLSEEIRKSIDKLPKSRSLNSAIFAKKSIRGEKSDVVAIREREKAG